MIQKQRADFRMTENTMKNLFLVAGIFLMIFSVDGFLLLDSFIPDCQGFTGMSLFVFVALGFDSRAILSNPGCLESFTSQIICGILFVVGLCMLIQSIVKRQKNKIQNNRQDVFA